MLTVDRQIDRRILQEADSLERCGFSVGIVALPLDDGATDADSRIRRATVVAQPTAYDRSYATMRRLLPHAGWMAALKAWAWRHLVDFEQFHVRLFESALADASAAIVIAHDLPTLPAACAFARKTGAKLVYDSHELYCEQSLHALELQKWRRLEVALIHQCDAVVTINPAIAAQLRAAYGIGPVEVVMNAEPLLPLPVRQRRFHAAFTLPADCRIVLYQGGLQRDRNLDVLIDVIDLLEPDVHLVFLGDGDLGAELARRAARSASAGRIHFHPRVGQDELRCYTASADIGLIPYVATCLNNRLCTPNKLFEFIGAGLPMVASDLPEISRLIAAHDLGVVVDFTDARAIAGAISAILADAEALARYRKAVQAAAQVVNWENEAEKFTALMRRLGTPA